MPPFSRTSGLLQNLLPPSPRRKPGSGKLCKSRIPAFVGMAVEQYCMRHHMPSFLRILLIFCQPFKKQIGIIAIASLKAPPMASSPHHPS
jgi:hypothetical protein